ncbi:MAG: diacylglycerol/lipid kinase family protein [Chloroflexota bacterium]
MDNRLEKKTFVLINPVAGKSDRHLVRQTLGDVLESRGIPYTIYETTKGDNPHQVVQTALAEGYERFLAAGGDGTIVAVASGLAHTDIPTVIVPTGTVNALAKFFNIPLALDQAARWWLSAQRVKLVDAMKVKDRLYVLSVSVGISAQVLSDVKRREKRRYGFLIYPMRALQRMIGLSKYDFRFVIDDRPYRCHASELMVANSDITQFKPLRLSPDIRMDDGKLALCYVRVNSIFDYFRIFTAMLGGKPTEMQEVTCLDVFRKVSIYTDYPIPVQADGDLIGKTPVSVHLIPGGVRFLVPEDAERSTYV